MLSCFRQPKRLRIEQLERRELFSAGALDLFSTLAQNATATIRDDYGNTTVQAAQVGLSRTGAGRLSGTIEKPGDVDMFRFTAPVTGRMTIAQAAAPGSALDSCLSVYRADQQLLASNDDSDGRLNSRVEIDVVAGSTYYLKAAAYQNSTGAYWIQYSAAPASATDDHANTLAQATQVDLSGSGSAGQAGRIERAGDVDWFSFVAPATGRMTIAQSATAGSGLDSYLYVYDANRRLVARNDDTGASLNSRAQLDVVAGTTYYVKAAAYQSSTGAYVLKVSTAQNTATPAPASTSTLGTTATSSTPASPGTSGAFQIDVTMSGLTASQQQVVSQAVARWERVLVGDLPDVTYQGRVIDDLEIAISAVPIDGTGGILGQSTATAFRSGSDLPYLGFIRLDTADVAAMQANGNLLGVLEHEMAHVLGFGVLWSERGLLVGAGTEHPGFIGPRAVSEYNALVGGNASIVPVEADGGSGTRLSHWDESLFGTELMTGWYNPRQVNAISRITVASLADLGYQVNMAAADSYILAT